MIGLDALIVILISIQIQMLNMTVEDGADALPNDNTQWSDLDLDGYGDNPSPALNPDSCPSVFGNSTNDKTDGSINEKLGCSDSDGDSFDDLSDVFPSDSTRVV